MVLWPLSVAWSTSRKKLSMRTGKTALLLMVCFHEPLYVRHPYTIKLPQG